MQSNPKHIQGPDRVKRIINNLRLAIAVVVVAAACAGMSFVLTWGTLGLVKDYFGSWLTMQMTPEQHLSVSLTTATIMFFTAGIAAVVITLLPQDPRHRKFEKG